MVVDNHVAGGVDVVTRLLLNLFTRHGVNVTVITNSNNPTLHDLDESLTTRVTFFRLRFVIVFLTARAIRNGHNWTHFTKLLFYLAELVAFPWYVLRFVVLFTRQPHASFLCMNGGYPGSILVRAAVVATRYVSTCTRCVLVIHSLAASPPRAVRQLEKALDLLVSRSVSVLAAVSATSLLSMNTRVGFAKIQSQRIIYNVSPMTLRGTEAALTPTQPDFVRFLMPSTYDRRKGHDVALEAFKSYLSRGGKGTLTFVGDQIDHYRDLLDDKAQRLGVRESVRLLPKSRNLLDLYEASDVVLAPYLGPESFCLVVLEGLACRLPVIATNIDAIVEVYGESKGVLLIPPNDSERLCDSMLDKHSLDLARQFLTSSRDIGLKHLFDQERLFREYEEALFLNGLGD